MWILKKFVPWKPVSEVFYTSNTLSIALCSSLQIRHCYVNFTTDTEGIQRGKAAWKLPLSMKDKSYTRDCTKQTSEFPQLQNIDLNLLTISFHLLFVYQTSTVVVVVAVVVVDFFNACMGFFLAHFLITSVRLWQIFVQKMYEILFGSLLNHLFLYTNKNISVKPFFNLHYLHLLAQKFFSSWRILP